MRYVLFVIVASVCCVRMAGASTLILNGSDPDAVYYNGNLAYIFGEPTDFLSLAVPDGRVDFYEDASLTTISDTIWSQNQQLNFYSTFGALARPSPVPTGIPQRAALVANGQLQDVSQYFGLSPGTLEVVTYGTVPEPSTVLLAGLGLAAILSIRLAKRQSSQEMVV